MYASLLRISCVKPLLLLLTLSFAFTWKIQADEPVSSVFNNPENQNSIVPADSSALKNPKMRWAPKDFAKDPTVVRFRGKCFMYFSIPPQEKDGGKYGWTTGIAQSDDLLDWLRISFLIRNALRTDSALPAHVSLTTKFIYSTSPTGTGPRTRSVWRFPKTG